MRAWLLLLLLLPGSLQATEAMLLLKTWQPDQDVSGWLMSEKLDGVRAYWDGHQLISRGGHPFAAPVWFTRDFPPFALDGELWSQRGDFEHIVSIVRRQQPHQGWRALAFHIFEAPNQPGGLVERLQVASEYLKRSPSPFLQLIRQIPCPDHQHLHQYLHQLVLQGAEGVVIRNPSAPYQTGRSADALKLKPYHDSECTVVAYKPGKGILKGKTGALRCRMENGNIINIGSGLSRQQRNSPPAPGQIITFKYSGFTAHGVPRHPAFLRLWPGDLP